MNLLSERSCGMVELARQVKESKSNRGQHTRNDPMKVVQRGLRPSVTVAGCTVQAGVVRLYRNIHIQCKLEVPKSKWGEKLLMQI